MIDIVIPLGYGSLWNNNELRYCLRSVQKHLHDFGKIFVIGERPYWLQHVHSVPVPETGASPAERIFGKIKVACEHSGVSENFLFLNDDFFFLKATSASKIQFLYDGYIMEVAAKDRRNGAYKEQLMNTHEWLDRRGYATKHFDIHTPYIINKHAFLKTVGSLPWGTYPGYAIKSVYCNMLNIPGWLYPDCKLNQPCQSEEELVGMIPDRFVFSIGDTIVNKVFEDYMQKLFPDKSKFEL